MAPVDTSDPLSLTFGALADPTRRAILARLAEGEAAVNELAGLAPSISLPEVSKHLQVLERAGLIARRRSARQRPAHLRTEPIDEASAWLAYHRRFYEESLDRLGEHLARLQAAEFDHRRDETGAP
jgi:DNA-binding transcriptional ArsR family regulator